MKMRKLLLWILLSFNFCYSLAFDIGQEHIINIPQFLRGIEASTSVDVKLQGLIKRKDIVPKNHKFISSPIQLIEKLIYCYQKNLKNDFFYLFEQKTLAKVKQMPKSEFEIEWKKLGTFKAPYIKYMIKLQDGFLLSWSAKNFASARGLFIKKIEDEFKITEKIIDKNDASLKDTILYLDHFPLEYKKAHLIKSFNDLKSEMTLILKVKPANRWVHIFKKEKNKWKLIVTLKDNDTENFLFPDKASQTGLIQVNFRPEHFTKEKKHALLILESNFPMQDIHSATDFKSNWSVDSSI